MCCDIAPGDDSWHLVLSAINHVFLGTLQEVFIMLTLTEHEHMLIYAQKMWKAC